MQLVWLHIVVREKGQAEYDMRDALRVESEPFSCVEAVAFPDYYYPYYY